MESILLMIMLSAFLIYADECHALNISTTSQGSGDNMNFYQYSPTVKIAYTDNGSGTPIVFVHGFPSSKYTWRHCIKHFSKDYRTIALDLKGFGSSSLPKGDKYTTPDQSDIVLGLLEELNLKNVTLVGHSYGGGLALYSYMRSKGNSSRIEKLVLVDAAAYAEAVPAFVKILRINPINKFLLQILPDEYINRTMLKKMFYDKNKITDEILAEYSSYMARDGYSDVLIQSAQNILPPDAGEVVKNYNSVKVPVLIVWGEEDEIIPLHLGRRLAKDIPGAILVVIENCGHMPQEECPERTIEIISDFLRDK